MGFLHPLCFGRVDATSWRSSSYFFVRASLRTWEKLPLPLWCWMWLCGLSSAWRGAIFRCGSCRSRGGFRQFSFACGLSHLALKPRRRDSGFSSGSAGSSGECGFQLFIELDGRDGARGLAQPFNVVESATRGEEDVHHEVHVVEEDPIALAAAFDGGRDRRRTPF